MALIDVPGPNHTVIDLTSAFFNAQGQPLAPLNAPLAQANANFLDSLVPIDPMLNVQTYTPPTTPAALASDVNQLVVPSSLSGGTVFTPPGYTFVVDGTSSASFTVVGAQNFLGGNGNLTVYNTVGASSVGGGIDTITAGNGNDLFGLVPGSTYTVAGGNGNDTYFANGNGAVADGFGSNLIFVGNAGGTNLALSFGKSDTVIAGAGANTVSTNGSDPLIFGGSGSLEVFGNTATNATVSGGSGSETIFGAQSGVYFLGSSTSLFIGGPSSSSTIVGTTRQETVFGGASSNEAIFTNSSSLLFVAGSGGSATIGGGSSPSTLFGSAGSDINYYSTAGGALFVAGSGNETLNAAGATTDVTLFGGRDTTAGNSLVGGAGNDALIAGTGSDTMTGGAGDNSFVFNSIRIGAVGGHDFIADYNTSDTVRLLGYGSAAGANALAAATVSGGNTTIALSDNTKITFENITTPSSIKIFSI